MQFITLQHTLSGNSRIILKKVPSFSSLFEDVKNNFTLEISNFKSE